MKFFFTEFLYRPLFNVLAWLYQNVAFEDLGIAIILLTLIIRVILFPLFHKTVKHQRITQNLQPRIKKIQKKHKNDKEQQAKEIIELYSEHKINPLTPIWALLIQLPIIFAVYRIFINGFSNGALDLLYPFIVLPETPSQNFLGLISDLTAPSLTLAFLAAIAQYFQGKTAFSKKGGGGGDSPAEKVGKKLVLFMPVIALLILANMPAAIGLYWFTTTVFSIFQQAIVDKTLNKKEEKDILLGDEDGKDKRNNTKNA